MPPIGTEEWFVCGLEGKMDMVWWYDPTTLDVLQIDYRNETEYPVNATVRILTSDKVRAYTLPPNTVSEVLLKPNEIFNRDAVEVECGFALRASQR